MKIIKRNPSSLHMNDSGIVFDPTRLLTSSSPRKNCHAAQEDKRITPWAYFTHLAESQEGAGSEETIRGYGTGANLLRYHLKQLKRMVVFIDLVLHVKLKNHKIVPGSRFDQKLECFTYCNCTKYRNSDSSRNYKTRCSLSWQDHVALLRVKLPNCLPYFFSF